MRNWVRSNWACRTYMSQTRCTATSLVTRPSIYMIGFTRLRLRLWPEIEKVSQCLLKYWRTPTPESERMPRAPASMSIGKTHPPQSRNWPGLPNVLGNLILKVRIGLRSSITPVHSMMAWGREKLDFPWERLTDEPLIYASMGTILNGRLDVFRTIVAGVAKHKDLQLVLSIGDQLDPEEIGPVPKNAIIVQRAPQLELLKQTSVCITHAGLNTVLESLAQGVPQVAVPVTFDQPGVAARVAHNQTGVVTSLEKLTAEHLSTLLNEVLNNSIYRDNACKLQKAIAQTNGLSVAADLVETSLGLTKKADNQS